MFTTAAALAGGAQALVPASAGAVTNTGGECAFAQADWWGAVQCELTYGEIGPNGVSGGDGAGAGNAAEPDIGLEPYDEPTGIYDPNAGDPGTDMRNFGDGIDQVRKRDDAAAKAFSDLQNCRIARQLEFTGQNNRSRLVDLRSSGARFGKRRKKQLEIAENAIDRANRDWQSYDCDTVFGYGPSGDY